MKDKEDITIDVFFISLLTIGICSIGVFEGVQWLGKEMGGDTNVVFLVSIITALGFIMAFHGMITDIWKKIFKK